MIIPPGKTEQEVIDAINEATKLLAGIFRFGPYEPADIRQQGAVFAIEVLNEGKYDNKRSLVKFLYTHIRNRLINFIRDNYSRNDPPCVDCHTAIPGNTKHADRQYCKKYLSWLNRNLTKRSLMCPLELSHVGDEEGRTNLGSDVVDSLEIKETLALIDKYLDVDLRADYLRLRDRVKISKTRTEQIKQEILRIIREHS